MARYDLDYGHRFDRGYGHEFRGTSPRGRGFARYGGEFRDRPRGDWGGSSRPRSGWFGGGGGHDEGRRGFWNRERGYDDEFRTVGLGYGEEYKSRWQTERGDPFGDRERHTPIRMMRGEWGEYDRDYGRAFRQRGYGSTFRSRRHW
jgi:hypothetical protein